MKKLGSRLGLLAVLLFWCGWIAFSGTTTASMDIQKQAKAAGIDASNCQYCHVDKLPKKDSHAFNERGQWLVAQKEKKNAKAVDGAWLKDYPGNKK